MRIAVPGFASVLALLLTTVTGGGQERTGLMVISSRRSPRSKARLSAWPRRCPNPPTPGALAMASGAPAKCSSIWPARITTRQQSSGT